MAQPASAPAPSLLAWARGPDLQQRVVDFLSPHAADGLEIEAALLLHNVPLFLAFCGAALAVLAVSYLFTAYLVPPLAYCLAFVPACQLLRVFRAGSLLRSFYLGQLPDLPEGDARRILPIADLVRLLWPAIAPAIRGLAQLAQAARAPALPDYGLAILSIIVADILCQSVNVFLVLGAVAAAGLAAPAAVAMTPAVPVARGVARRVSGLFARRKRK
jgi:hypothetical protein